jgi:hypothetical protein
VPFVDVREDLGATCALVTRYLIEQEVPLPTDVATGLHTRRRRETRRWTPIAGIMGYSNDRLFVRPSSAVGREGDGPWVHCRTSGRWTCPRGGRRA